MKELNRHPASLKCKSTSALIKRKILPGSKKTFFSVFALLIFLLAPPAHAQFFEKLFSKKIPVRIEHPPGLSLNAERVAINLDASYSCDETKNLLQGEIVNDFITGGIEVLDRENLDQILNEQRLATSGITDQTTAVNAEELAAASVILNLRVNSCDADQERSYRKVTRYDKESKKNYYVREYLSKASFLLRASVQVTDLRSGHVIGAKSLEKKPEVTNSSFEGYPIYPDSSLLQNQAIDSVTLEVHKMFLPWVETQRLVLYKNKKCNLRQTYNSVKSGLITDALAYAERSVEACNEGAQIKGRKGIKTKVVAQAYYNLGMVQMILGEHETAIQTLQRAQQIRPGDLVNKAIGTTQKAWNSRRALTAIENVEQVQIEQQQASTTRKRQAKESSTLTNQQVIEFTKQGLSEVIVIQLIESAGTTRLDITPLGLVALSAAGLSDKVMQSVIKKASQQN